MLQDVRKLLGGHKAVHDGGIFLKYLRGCRTLKYLVHLAVHAPDLGVYHRFLKVVAYHIAVKVEVHQRREGQLLGARVQGADPV